MFLLRDRERDFEGSSALLLLKEKEDNEFFIREDALRSKIFDCNETHLH
jgi:hypothetical protein